MTMIHDVILIGHVLVLGMHVYLKRAHILLLVLKYDNVIMVENTFIKSFSIYFGLNTAIIDLIEINHWKL